MVNFYSITRRKQPNKKWVQCKKPLQHIAYECRLFFTHSILHQRKQSDRMIPSCKSVNRELPVDRKKQFLRQKVNILEMETDATNLQSGEECDFHKHGRVKSIR